VLVVFLVTLGLAAVGAVAVAIVTRAAMRRLGFELLTVLMWFGLAEAPREPAPARALVAVPA
jgi:hypothetical protein